MNDNTKKMILNRNGDWFVEHGYTHPNDIIDHNANLQLPEKFIQIFSAYNQHNIAESKEWDTWPEWGVGADLARRLLDVWRARN